FHAEDGIRAFHVTGVQTCALPISIWLIADKLYAIAHDLKYRNVTDQPLFYIALVAIIVGFQLFLTGFIAELISRNGSERNEYQKIGRAACRERGWIGAHGGVSGKT